MFFSFTMLSPLITNFYFAEQAQDYFIYSFFITFATGLLLFMFCKNTTKRITTKDGFIIVISIWVCLSIFGALPYILMMNKDINITRCIFEYVSGFTATGGSVFRDLSILPKAIIYYRQQSQFLGGMGIIVLSVAILPLLGVGGMKLYRAEPTGPWKDRKLTAKISETAKVLWLIYIFFTLYCILSYLLSGMNFFDAVCYAFSTVSTGGFAPSNTGMIGQSNTVLGVCIVFMLLSATSFRLHFLAIFNHNLKVYFKDPELKSYFIFIFFMVIIITLTLISFQEDGYRLIDVIWDGVFQVVSFASNTGFISNYDYYIWPTFIPVLMMFIALIGGCAGSTSSGLKMVRSILFKEKAFLEAKRVIHPEGIFSVKLGDQFISEEVLNRVSGFVSAYFMFLGLVWLVLLGIGLDSMTSFSAAVATLSNVGPGLANIGVNYADLSDNALWVLDFSMLVGRLEVFTVVVIFMPYFWRQ